LKFRTEIKLEAQQQNKVDHKSKVLLLGSCFSESMGRKLSYYQFDTLINPFGTLFSPTAIAKVIEDTVVQKKHKASELVVHGDLFHSLHHHSDLSGSSPEVVLDHIHHAQQSCFTQLTQASHVMITLGSSWVYQYISKNQWVANCHKIPQSEFRKVDLTLAQIEEALVEMVTHIRKINSSVQIIFTVSPVRHLKDGMIENSISKAKLVTAVQLLRESHAVAYFGSYEIMMDDLRDYRFYEADMVHPNSVAVDYIWDQFSRVWIDEKSQSYFKRIASLRKSKEHRPFQKHSISHQFFLETLAKKQQELEQELKIKFDA
jgi:hypothetical protein